MKYSAWEESQKEFERCRSVYERALEVDYRNQVRLFVLIMVVRLQRQWTDWCWYVSRAGTILAHSPTYNPCTRPTPPIHLPG